MTSEKSSSPDEHRDDIDTSVAHSERGERVPSGESENISDDLNRIASYLTEKRETQSTRHQDLLDEIAQRRAESADQVGVEPDRAGPVYDLPDMADDDDDETRDSREPHFVSQNKVNPLTPNPILAERLDAFCRDLDQMFEKFRAQIDYKNSVKH